MNINTANPVNRSGGSIDTAVSSAAPIKQTDAESVQAERKVIEKEASPSTQEVKELAEGMNEMMDGLHTSIGFSIREELGSQVVVEIKDRKTNELIKQIPSEELLLIKEKMDEFTGLLFDQSI